MVEIFGTLCLRGKDSVQIYVKLRSLMLLWEQKIDPMRVFKPLSSFRYETSHWEWDACESPRDMAAIHVGFCSFR